MTAIDRRTPRGDAPLKGESSTRTLALCLGSVGVMIVWPLLGIMLMQPSFETASEAFMLFGGVTMFPLMILALFGPVPAQVLIMLIMLVWLSFALLPHVWLRRAPRSWTAVGALFLIQSLCSLAQAGIGALLILGKSI